MVRVWGSITIQPGVSLGYLAGDANDPADGSALFNGPYSALAQVVIAERSFQHWLDLHQFLQR